MAALRPPGAAPSAGRGSERPVLRHEAPDLRLLPPHAREHPRQVAGGGLAQAVILDHRPHVVEVDAGGAQQPQQGALHHGAPMGDALPLAELHQAAHQGQARQAGGCGAQPAAVLGQGEARDFRRAREGQGGEPLRRADGLHREAAAGACGLQQDQAGGADDRAAAGQPEHNMLGVRVVAVNLKAILARLIAPFQTIDLMPQLMGVTDQFGRVGDLHNEFRGGGCYGRGQDCFAHGTLPVVGLRVSRLREVNHSEVKTQAGKLQSPIVFVA